jgi:hypothetical protein
MSKSEVIAPELEELDRIYRQGSLHQMAFTSYKATAAAKRLARHAAAAP